MQRTSRVHVAGHTGLVGSAIVRRLLADGCECVLTASRAECDLRDPDQVDRYFAASQPEYVFLAAARVGGIHANSAFPADFIRDNLQIQTNVIDASHRYGVRKLLFLGSSCIYPRECPQPIREEYLLTAPLEPTNAPYAVAKIAGLIMCQSYRRQFGMNAIVAMPTNLYGPGDSFDLENAHVLPALLRRMHEARQGAAPDVIVWGTGAPRREFLHVDDLADACVFLMREYDGMEPINVGCGEDVSIRELAEAIRDVVGYRGELRFDTSRPDGTPRKLLDVSRLTALGWTPRIALADGLRSTYSWYCEHAGAVRGA
ncbi:MAG TPA: GDP-L-fucose synthase [Chthonomonadales bacterium]|nr:GDP-L-fucose synthase [Chthonomonadales bacterium]